MHGIILTGFSSIAVQKAQYRRTGGAHRLATYLRERSWDIEVLDFIMGWSLHQLKDFTISRVSNKTVFLGFGGTFPIWSNTLESYFSWFKEKYPDIKIIAGGQVANSYKIEADWYVDGFGEKAVEALLRHITSNEKIKFKIGINGRKIINGNQDYPSFPMKDLHISYQERDFINPKETLVTELGRGCIFKCSFCNFPILGVKEDHSRDAENLRKELQENYDRWGVTKYIIADETVNDYSEKLEKFARVIKTLNFRPRLFGFARADLMISRPQDWDTMIEMGFTGHHYGIESTNIKSLKVIGKGMHPDKLLPGLLEARSYFKKHAIYKGQVSLIAGLPYETPDSLKSSLKWFNENWKTENVMLFPFYIPKSNGNDTMSKMSIDYKKYGYKETKIDLYPQIRGMFSGIPTQYGVGEGLLENTGMSWENEYWNIMDAVKIVVRFYTNDYVDTYGPIMWSVGEYELAFDEDFSFFNNKTFRDLNDENTDVSSLLKLTQSSNYLINDYITKKLNWVEKK
jgi:radical SAM superfamily enzyme YgiQ (UPF0313 family)